MNVLLVQLPIPRLDFGRRTGNVPLGAACLKQAAAGRTAARVDILPESVVSYLGDAALERVIQDRRPDVVGFSVFSWNVARSLHLSQRLKAAGGVRTLFGGPEVTSDTPLAEHPAVDLAVCGEGEAVFIDLLTRPQAWDRPPTPAAAGRLFTHAPSPYLAGCLEPAVEDLMLLETQRGCPYRCAFCYYNKARHGVVTADETRLLEGVAWAVSQDLGEVYLLDPSLDTRPGLTDLLARVTPVTRERRTRLIGEMRAEAVDAGLAAGLAAAGFSWLEIGLQTTTPEALRLMRRPTDLKRFARGTALLQAHGITPGIDLIAGLPGDTLAGFKRSVDFVVAQGLDSDVQVFPLAVLPGTGFRRRAAELGVVYDPRPPYHVRATPTFTAEDLLAAFDYAEARLDVALFQMPDLNVAWRVPRPGRDVEVELDGRTWIRSLVLTDERPLEAIAAAAAALTHPYQIVFTDGAQRPAYMAAVLACTTGYNPFSPCEVVLLDPVPDLDLAALEAAAKLHRPHFLDADLRYLLAREGNRALLITLVTSDPTPRRPDGMCRQVHWWRGDRLPRLDELDPNRELEGVLIDVPLPSSGLIRWQDRLAPRADELTWIGFARVDLQMRWLALTLGDEYYLPLVRPANGMGTFAAEEIPSG